MHAPSWTTLIHPVPVVLEVPLRGTELDLASSALGALQESGDPGIKYCIHATSELCIARWFEFPLSNFMQANFPYSLLEIRTADMQLSRQA
jgi:hypothetical protein